MDDLGNGGNVDFLGSVAFLIMLIPLYLFSRPMKETGGTANYLWLKYRHWLEDEESRLRLGLWLARVMILQTFALWFAVTGLLIHYVLSWVGGFSVGDAVQFADGPPSWIIVIVFFTCIYTSFALCMPLICSADAVCKAVERDILGNE